MRSSGIKLVAGVCLSGICLLAVPTRADEWRTDYVQAQRDAQRLQLPMLIHFHAEWCSPCRRMDREVLRAPQLTRMLGRQVIAIKVDSDRNPRLVKKYGIRALPSDVIVDPQGRKLQQSTGLLSRSVYIARLSTAIAPYAKQNASQTDVAADSQRKDTPTPRASVAEPQTRRPRAVAGANSDLAPLEQVPVQRPEPMIGLDAYSPVSLWNSRQWKKGTAEFQVEFQQVTYYLVDEAELRLFQSNPRKYAPRLTGCDPVIMTETDQAIAGNTQYGAFFDSGLYLFASQASREQFKKSPLRYTRIQHARRLDAESDRVRR